MPKRDISEFIAHWSAASHSERAKPVNIAEILETPVTFGCARKQG